MGRMIVLVVIFAMACVLGLPAVATAQFAGAGTGSIVGVVKDPAGLPVRAVEVSITGPSLMGVRTTSTREDGGYRFVWLTPGDYVITFASPGFESVRKEEHISLGRTMTIDVSLLIAAPREEVLVAGTLDRHSVAISQSFDARTLARIPSSRSLGGLLASTHAIMLPSAEVGGGMGIVSGANGAYGRSNAPRHTMENLVVTGLFGAGFVPDYGALEEVSVVTAGFGAEWASAGIHTDITTKSGSNQYRGTLYAAAEHRWVQSMNVDADQILRVSKAGGGVLPRDVNQLWSNNDLNADVGGFLQKDRVWWYSSFRRESVEARLVNFDVVPYATKMTNYSGKATVRLSPGHRLIAYGQLGINDQPNNLDAFTVSNAVNETIDSTANQRNTTWLWKTEWNASMSDSVLFELRAGQFANDTAIAPHSSALRYEDVEAFVVRGGGREYEGVTRRNQVNGAASVFFKNRTGQHALRIGGDVMRFSVTDTYFGYPENVLHVLRSGRPYQVYLFRSPTHSKVAVWTWSAYVSDSWQLGHRLTITPGLRYDGAQLTLPAQSGPPGSDHTEFPAIPNLAHWNRLSPRLSAVFDISGDGRLLGKVSYNRFSVPPNASVAINANPNSTQWWKLSDWRDPNQNGRFDVGEDGREQRRRGGFELESIDPALQLPVLHEVGAWIEGALPGRMTLRTGGVWRFENSQFTRQNIYQQYKDFTVPGEIPDRGPDGLEGTADDGPKVIVYDLDSSIDIQEPKYQLRNVPGVSSRYFTWEIDVERRARGRWTAGAGFAHTWNRDHAAGYAGQSIRNNTYPLTPNDLINTGAGGRHEFTTWTAKAHGTLELPWQLQLTPVLRHQSGQPFGRTQRTNSGDLRSGAITILMEPIGTRRMDHITLVDVRLEKSMHVKSDRLSVFLDVFNGFNANPEQNVVWSSGSSFLRPLTIVPPRIARLGLTFDW